MDSILRPAGRLLLECQSVELAYRILDFLRCGQQNASRVAELEGLLKLYRQTLSSLYDRAILKVKAHLMFHVPCSIRRTGYIMSCFSNERRHRLMIGTTSHYKNAGNATSPASRFILARLLVDLEHRILQSQCRRFVLTSKLRECTANFVELFTSRRLVSAKWAVRGVFDSVSVRKGNVVRLSDSASEAFARVELLCELTFSDNLSQEVYALVNFMRSVDGTTCTESGVIDFVAAKCVVAVMCVVERTGGIKIVCRA